MRKITKVALLLPLLAASVVLAQGIPGSGGGLPTTLPSGASCTGFGCVTQILDNVFNFLFWLVIVLAVIFFLVGAILYVTGAGNDEKIKKAKSYLIYGAIAVAVAILAKAIPGVVKVFTT